MDSITRRFSILCLGVLAAVTAACASNNVTQCETNNILCPSGFHCAAAQPICLSDTNLCGNGHVDPGEACDDGNTQDGDECSHDCTSDLSCGNSITDVAAKVPEQCDDGAKNGKLGDPCSATCQMVRCGNGVVEQGEECDDGNVASGDGCSATCQSEFCGNGHIDPGEVCDDGNKNGTPGDPCSANCRSNLTCNNHIVDPGEECDNGTLGAGNPNGNSNSNDCRADCQFNRCGDGFVDMQTGGRKEQCDAGHLNGLVPVPTETAGCNIDCTTPSCGDGKINRSFTPKDQNGNPAAGPEQCDDGAANNDNADCTATCQINVCGDGHQDMTGTHKEDCDDGAMNGVVGDKCTKDCHLVSCGNGVLDPGEECDDGGPGGPGNGMGKRCNASCKLNFCGDGDTLKDVEQCDDGVGGVAKDSTTCDHDCTSAVCGDGYQNMVAGEACDDGKNNGKPGSLCSFTCQKINCGNGVVEQGEECDDGGPTGPGNGTGKRCNISCVLNRCGDGDTLIGVEQCDDGVGGAPTDSTKCDHDCTFAVCGDGYVNKTAGEDCDDGDKNGTLNDMCDAFCHFKGCGNGFVEATEQCDPNPPASSGPPVNTSACDKDCTLPVCGDGLFNDQANEQCDKGSANGDPCPYGQKTCSSCDLTCHTVIATGPFCGDNQINGPLGGPLEVCDQGALNGTQCAYGDMACLLPTDSPICNNDCKSFIKNPNGPFCGDGAVQPQFEECDPGNGITPKDTATCDSDCKFPVCGDGHTNLLANEACDDRNTSACGTCSADCLTITSAVATGKIIAVGAIGTNINDGDTFTLNDGFKQNTFEFNLNGGVTMGNVAITVANGDDANTVAKAIISAIGNGTVNITAKLGSSNDTVVLTNGRVTSHGNQTITLGETNGIATSFTFSGMSGGKGGDCDTGVGCAIDDDCTSQKCTNHRCQ